MMEKEKKIQSRKILRIVITAIIIIGIVIVALHGRNSYHNLVHSMNQYTSCENAARDMMSASDYLTEQARLYAMTGNPIYMQNYYVEVKETKRRDVALETLQSYFDGTESFQALQDAFSESIYLMEREYYSMRLISEAAGVAQDQWPDEVAGVELLAEDRTLTRTEMMDKGQGMLFDAEYETVKYDIRTNTSECFEDLLELAQSATKHYEVMFYDVSWKMTFGLIGVVLLSAFLIAAQHKQKLLNDRLQEKEEDLQRKLDVIGATSQRYFCAYTFDIDNDRFHEVFTLPNMHEVLGSEGQASSLLKIAYQKLVIDEDKETMAAFHDISRWREYLADQDIHSCEYRGITSGWSRGNIYAAERDANGQVTHVVYTLEKIHEQKQTEQQLKQQLKEIDSLNERLKASQDSAIQALLDLVFSQSGERLIFHVMEIVGRYYKADRSYVFETDETGKFTNNTFEWCAKGIHPEIDNLKNIPIEVISTWNEEFKKNGCFYISCDDEYAKQEPMVYEVLEPQGISSLIAAPMIVAGKHIGFIGVDNPRANIEHKLYLSIAATVIHHEVRAIREQEKEAAYQRELEEASYAAQSASRAKSDFLFNMSHDIRTPMNAIIGYANLMEKHRGEPEKQSDYLSKLKQSSEYLLELINNVLEMARIESGKMVLSEELCDVLDIEELVTAMFSDSVREKKLQFTKNIKLEHRYVIADDSKMNQILVNLLSNAIKYTPEGNSVSLEIREGSCSRPGFARFEMIVSDTGIGMSKEFQKQIFDSFTREKTSTESKVIGTGLGMAIVKKLVDLMGGTIEVESELGKGSSFRVTVEQRIATVEDNKKPDEQQDFSNFSLTGKRILLAEDNELNAEIAIEILSEFDLCVDHAIDGLACLDMITRKETGYYDLILMDVQMPNLNGYETTKRIRDLADPIKASIPIIVLSANAFEEDRKKAIESGMNGFVPKPIDVSALMKAIIGVL